MGDEKEDYQILIDEWSSMDTSNISIGDITISGTDSNYDDWLAQYANSQVDIDYDWVYPSKPIGANNISLTGGGQEILRIAEDGFYVNGVKVKQGKREAKAVYEAFKKWMTHAIMSGELNN